MLPNIIDDIKNTATRVVDPNWAKTNASPLGRILNGWVRQLEEFDKKHKEEVESARHVASKGHKEKQAELSQRTQTLTMEVQGARETIKSLQKEVEDLTQQIESQKGAKKSKK